MIKLALVLLLYAFGVNMSFSQPILVISGEKDSSAVFSQLTQYLQSLGVDENVLIHLDFYETMPEDMEGITFVQKTFANSGSPNDQLIKVRIDAHLSKRRQKLALAHEMIHVKQYVKGELEVIDEHHVIWKGFTYSYQRPEDRKFAPWEHEAYRLDNTLVNKQ